MGIFQVGYNVPIAKIICPEKSMIFPGKAILQLAHKELDRYTLQQLEFRYVRPKEN